MCGICHLIVSAKQAAALQQAPRDHMLTFSLVSFVSVSAFAAARTCVQ